MSKCIYCDKPLDDTVKAQHIIFNAVCGRLTSKDICCSTCNELLGMTLDRQFTSQFSPILKRAYNLYKTNNAKNWPGDVQGASDVELEFDLTAFSQGMAKIAVEFAAHSNYCKFYFNKDAWIEMLRKNILAEQKNGELKSISFTSQVIPFYPLNPFDEYIELEAPFYLRHKLILFSHKNYLVCYVELFSTFECYVILSTCWAGDDIYTSYVQEIKRLSDESNVDCSFRSIKDFQIILMENNLWPLDENLPKIIKNTEFEKDFEKMKAIEFWTDEEKFAKIVDISTRKKYYNEIPLDVAVEQLITQKYTDKYAPSGKSNQNICDLNMFAKVLRSTQFYLDENDHLVEAVFRKFTPSICGDKQRILFYPTELSVMPKSLKVSKYWNKKKQRLLSHLRE